MKRGGIINRELSEVIAKMGHGQILMVSDAGCPIPKGVKCVDLSLTRGTPLIETVLRILDTEFITEKVMFANEVVTNNPDLYHTVQSIFTDADIESIAHHLILNDYAFKAEAIIRTGDYNPWGNIVLVAGTDPFPFFSNANVTIPEFYKKRFTQIRKSGKIQLYDQSGFERDDV